MPPALLLLALIVAVGIALLRARLHRSSSLPPGPKGHWLLGTTVPKENAHEKYEEWIQEFGPVFTLRQGTKITIVVGRLDAAIDILDKQSSTLNDRPVSIAMGETLSGGLRMLFSPNDDRFRKMRRYGLKFIPRKYHPLEVLFRAMHAYLYPKAVASYYPALKREAHQHILEIIEDPTNYMTHASRYSMSVVFTTAYGKRAASYKDPVVVGINRVMANFGANLRPGAWKVDVFPFLRYIPGYLRPLKDAHTEDLGFFRNQLDGVRQQKNAHEEVPDSLSRYLIENEATLGLSNDEMAYLAGSMFGAGSGTSSAAIGAAISAAACFPAAQARVQAELDAVVGRDRAPTLADREMLPQTMAFMLETFRWQPALPLGISHRATKTILWKNYQIPKGATVIGSAWSIGRDAEVFPNPEDFDPQRFITGDGKLRDDFKLFTFGFARRICPGLHLAQSSLFLNIALIHWAFKIKADPNAVTNIRDRRPLAAKFEPRIGPDFGPVRSMLEEDL
ncbi:cytochrome P450 [Mycena crocata]|nr:cytochrome P450 [Mycena crocata]